MICMKQIADVPHDLPKVKALELLHRSRSGKRVLVDIEVPDANSENAEQRILRKRFYLRAGYEETPVKYEWRHESYEILAFGGQITEAEYEQFWKDLKNSAPEGREADK